MKRGGPGTTRPALPIEVRLFQDFARLLRASGFRVAPEQLTGFLRAIELLGPRSMNDIRLAAVATLAPGPDRRPEFEALFDAFFYGVGQVVTTSDGEEEVQVKDDASIAQHEALPIERREGGALSASAEQLSKRMFESDAGRLDRFRREIRSRLPSRRSFRTVQSRTNGILDLRRSLRQIVRGDGDLPAPSMRHRLIVPRRLLLLIDISGSMKDYTQDCLRVAHQVVQGTQSAEIFTIGTRLTRVTGALKVRNQEDALARVAALVDDWDGGTRIGPTLMAFLAIPRFSALARGAAVVIISDGLERGDHTEMETALRRLSQRAYRLSFCTPLAGDTRFQPQTAALKAILPVIDDLVDGSSVAALTDFLLSLGRPSPSAAAIWRKVS
ncbi:MAG: VWA domain-containing protein [Rhizobiaceae bacterium]